MIRGIKIYEQQESYTSLLNLLEELTLNTVYISRELALDDTFLNALPPSIQKALIYPFLYDSDGDLKQHSESWAILEDGTPAKEEWVEFICPNATELLDEKVARYIHYAERANVEIFSIDFIRYFAFWEKTRESNANKLKSSCFCPRCMEEFSHFLGRPLPKLEVNELSLYILKNYGDQFTNYRCDKIVSLVSEVCRRVKEQLPHIKISLHLVPWQGEEYNNAIERITAQSVEKLSELVHIITPMCYHFMLRRSPQWISDYLRYLREQTSATILPSLQVSHCYRKEQLNSREFAKSLEALKSANCDNFLLWSGEKLLLSQEKQEILKNFS